MMKVCRLIISALLLASCGFFVLVRAADHLTALLSRLEAHNVPCGHVVVDNDQILLRTAQVKHLWSGDDARELGTLRVLERLVEKPDDNDDGLNEDDVKSLLPTASFQAQRPFASNSTRPLELALRLKCVKPADEPPHWETLAVLALRREEARKFAVLALPAPRLRLCEASACSTACFWSAHAGVEVQARSCCRSSAPSSLLLDKPDKSTASSSSAAAIPSATRPATSPTMAALAAFSTPSSSGWSNNDPPDWACRTSTSSSGSRLMLAVFSAICLAASLALIPSVRCERRRALDGRIGASSAGSNPGLLTPPTSWALMEPLLAGAALLYGEQLLELVELFAPDAPTCALAVWLRQLGFTAFYGSILLKIYRHMQEWRVRRAHHVFVRESDLLKIMAYALVLTLVGLIAWTVAGGSSSSSVSGSPYFDWAWPQCGPLRGWPLVWALLEMVALLVGCRLCWRTRNAHWWPERIHFSVALVVELLVSTTAHLIRLWLGALADAHHLFLVGFLQLHATVTVNTLLILIPKFCNSGLESSSGSGGGARHHALSMSVTGGGGGGGGGGGRAHPSLAKLREHILSGKLDFSDVPIAEMNHEDIRAELKRVYTQLRMYKLKNIYQDNPHVSRRKGGLSSSANPPPPPPPSSSGPAMIAPASTVKWADTAAAAAKNATTTPSPVPPPPKPRRLSLVPSAIRRAETTNNNPSGGAAPGRGGGGGGGGGDEAEGGDDEQIVDDKTVESAPHNVYLLQQKQQQNNASRAPPLLLNNYHNNPQQQQHHHHHHHHNFLMMDADEDGGGGAGTTGMRV